MKTRFPLWVLATLIVFIAVADACANYFHLYYLIWWLDIPMHVLGGTWVALSILVFYYRFAHLKRKDHSQEFVFALAIAAALVIGIGWEIYGWSIDHMLVIANGGVFDTLKDLTDDLIGALVAGSIFIKGGYNKAS